MRYTFFLVVVLFSFSAFAMESAPKALIPDEDAQKSASTVIAHVYKPDYEKAKTPAQKLELAKKLLGEGIATKDDSVSRFVLFRIARDIAAQQGDLVTAFAAIDRVSGEFDIDRMQMQVDAARTSTKALKLPKDHQAFANVLAPIIDEAISVDRYDLAKLLVALTLSAAKEVGDSEFVKQMTSKSKEIKELTAEFENVKESKVVLDTMPTDPSANFVVGRFLCLVKGDWKRGVLMLALGSNEEFKAAAMLELEEKPDALKLGDGWWKVSEGLEGTAQTQAQSHAAYWYRRTTGVSGLTKARIEQRLGDDEPKRPMPTVKSKTTKLREQFAPDALFYNGHYYKVVWKEVDWSVAFKACEEVGGHLACLESDAEQQMAANMKGEGKVIWVGGLRNAKGFFWINKKPITQSVGIGDEKYPFVAFDVGGGLVVRPLNGKTSGFAVNSIQGFICEWDE